MGEQIFLTAEEARTLAFSSTAMRNHLYKQIKEEAKECHTSTMWCVTGVSETLVTRLINDLRDNGYTVDRDLDDEPDMLRIYW